MKTKVSVEKRNYHRTFAVLSLLTLAGLLWAGYDDIESRRPWKDYQRRFYSLQRELLEGKVKAEEESLASPEKQEKIKAIEGKIAEAEKAIREWEGANPDKVKDLKALEEKIHDTEMGITFRKSELDEAFYRYQHAKIQGHDFSEHEAEMKRLEETIQGSEADLAKLQAQKTEIAKAVEERQAEIKKLRGELNAAERGLTIAKQNLSDLESPTLEIKQVVLKRLEAVDRCTSCHVGVDDATFEGEKIEEPFRTHPHLKELLGENHPIESFGCTVCHDGQGAQTKGVGWEKFEHGWDDHYWERPLLKGPFVQSTCLACHEGYADQEHAPVLSRGKALFVEVGCYGCHRMEGIDPLRKQAPKLNGVATKTTREWIERWLRNPKAWRPGTRMPNFWPEALDESWNDRAGSPELAKREAEVRAITEFLMSLTEGEEGNKGLDPAETDAEKIERGKATVQVVGCKACHNTGEGDRPKSDGSPIAFGPDLSRVGEKLKASWLKAWLADPKAYWNRTLMPSLRLTDEQAEDAATYLLTLHKDQGGSPRAEIPAEAEKGPLVERGRKLVSFYGCFGCHEIAGFEKAMPIGIELTEFGEKPTERLDYGEVKIKKKEKNWYDWTNRKLHNPRVYRTKRIDLKMPQFNLADDEIEAIMVFLRGMARPKNPEEYRIQAPEKTSAGRGEELVRRFNCRGCHQIGAKGGDIFSYLEDQGSRPPVLTGEGKKVQGEWLFRFLRAPVTLRPWLKTRMPTFGFDEEQANDIVNYFVQLAGQKLPYPGEPWKALEGEKAHLAKDVFGKLKCMQCHVVSGGGSGGGQQLSDLAPDLSMAAGRLRPEWVVQWLLGPQVLQPGTKMPDFFPMVDEEDPESERSTPLPDVLDGDVKKQVELIRDYLGNLASHASTAAAAGAPAGSGS